MERLTHEQRERLCGLADDSRRWRTSENDLDADAIEAALDALADLDSLRKERDRYARAIEATADLLRATASSRSPWVRWARRRFLNARAALPEKESPEVKEDAEWWYMEDIEAELAGED